MSHEEKHEDKTDWTTSEELEEHLTAKTGEILELWDKLGLPKDKPVDNDRGPSASKLRAKLGCFVFGIPSTAVLVLGCLCFSWGRRNVAV